jgi:hypothetical protein
VSYNISCVKQHISERKIPIADDATGTTGTRSEVDDKIIKANVCIHRPLYSRFNWLLLARWHFSMV